jgi:hypothetical protein
MDIFGIFKIFPLCEQMEHSLSLLTFKGSITEAIIEAKRQKKLFVVYISGKRLDLSYNFYSFAFMEFPINGHKGGT